MLSVEITMYPLLTKLSHRKISFSDLFDWSVNKSIENGKSLDLNNNLSEEET